MLKTSESTESTTQPEKYEVRISGDNRAKCDSRCELNSSEIGGGEVDGNELRDDKIKKKDQKMFKSKKLSKFKNLWTFLLSELD